MQSTQRSQLFGALMVLAWLAISLLLRDVVTPRALDGSRPQQAGATKHTTEASTSMR